jgi:hypothetical protein
MMLPFNIFLVVKKIGGGEATTNECFHIAG